MQAVDLKLLHLEAADDRPPDGQPTNRQGADGNSPQGRCPDRPVIGGPALGEALALGA